MPRAATSVVTSTAAFFVRNRPIISVRCSWSMEPYTTADVMPTLLRSSPKNSTWCLVATNMIVDLPGFAKKRRTAIAAATFSSLRAYKYQRSKSSLKVVSTSSRTNAGSFSPTLEKDTNCAGNVAEKRRHCLEMGVASKIFCNCSAKPNSKSRSASSITNTSTRERDKSASRMWCINLPGVAMTTSGLLARCSNCASMACPPTNKQHLKSVNLLSSLKNFAVCIANSLVGDKATARIPTATLCFCRRSMTGIRKAAVLPEPVRAIATTSWPSRMVGIVFLWIGVGML
mmetsp:Transcript_97766/g.273645  ORF Transcript_97766/g.273645 Transcript_97766/m.273645 type:complete len:287 (-) Transcript_97766:149-1009(-)